MNKSIVNSCAISQTSVAAVAAATDITSGTIIDLQGYDSVCFIAALGAVTSGSVVALKAYCGNAAALGDGAYKAQTATVTGTATAAFADNNVLVLDVIRPGKRYVRADLSRATQNCVLNSIIALKYNAKMNPVTQSDNLADGKVSVN